MAEINLLPQAEKEKGLFYQVLYWTKKAGVIFGAILFIVVLVYGGFYGYYYISDSIVTDEQKRLENEIRVLEPTEQKIVLLRDRIGKTNKILSAPKANEEAVSFIELTNKLPSGVTIQQAKLLPTEYEITVKADASKQLSELLRQLVSSGKYQRVELQSLNFSPKERYTLSMKLLPITTN